METRHSGLTVELARVYERAAAVCLDQVHQPPIKMDVTETSTSRVYDLDWVTPSMHERSAYANLHDSTEWGAYGVALATVEKQLGLVAVERAEQNTGADYLLLLAAPGAQSSSTRSDVNLDFEGLIRLEVSGTLRGDHSEVTTRLGQKVEQLRRGKSAISDGVAAVVGFAAREVHLERLI